MIGVGWKCEEWTPQQHPPIILSPKEVTQVDETDQRPTVIVPTTPAAPDAMQQALRTIRNHPLETAQQADADGLTNFAASWRNAHYVIESAINDLSDNWPTRILNPEVRAHCQIAAIGLEVMLSFMIIQARLAFLDSESVRLQMQAEAEVLLLVQRMIQELAPRAVVNTYA